MEKLDALETDSINVETEVCILSRTFAGFPQNFQNTGATLESCGLLPFGSSINCVSRIDASGRVAGHVQQYGTDTASTALLEKTADWLFPGAVLLHTGVAQRAKQQVWMAPKSPVAHNLKLGPNAGAHRSPASHLHPAAIWPWRIGQALGVLAKTGGGSLEIGVRNILRDAKTIREIEAAQADATAACYREPNNESAVRLAAALRSIAEDRFLFSIEVAAWGDAVGELELALVSEALFGTHDFDRVEQPSSELRCWVGSAHAVPRLAPVTGEIAWLRKRCSVDVDATGLVLGHAGSALVALPERDRARHLYLIGSTGTGKTTLMRRLISQDVAKGDSVIVIDPHGDLSREVAAAVPAERQEDLVFCDAADVDGKLALAILPTNDDPVEAEKSIDALLRILMDALYANAANAFGPVFEQYFRSALLLLLAAPPEERQLSAVSRIFSDEAYRNLLLDQCKNTDVYSFWKRTAAKTSGDMSLANVTPYVTSKLNRLVGSPDARRIFRTSADAIDFGQLIDQGKIIVLRCPKGVLGENLSGLVMAASLMKLEAALMARCEVKERRPVRLYVDEFQAAKGQSLALLLAEGRKFGVSLTLANQSLGQIDSAREGSLGNAVLANAANLLIFRVGAPDAQKLAPWLGDPGEWRKLCNLPDFTMAARLLQSGRPVTFDELTLQEN